MQGDAALLRQLLLNLFGNGLKFHRPGVAPVVRVGRAPRRRRWEITVADNGIGVEPEYADKIFVIFQRLHGREVYAGTGIGLALVKKIVEFHGGRVWLDSTPRDEPGTVIRFTLPGRDATARTEPAGDRDRSPRPAMINVLLVEDDPGDVLMTREAFDDYLHNRLDVVTDGAGGAGVPAQGGARTPTRPGPTSSCSTSTCPAATAARCCRRSRTTRTCGTSR